jgi:hypothetical protein
LWAKRSRIAQQLFGSILPTARFQSAGAGSVEGPAGPAPAPVSQLPPPPPVTVTAVAGTLSAPPAPMSAHPRTPATAASPGDVSVLLQSIQGGPKQKKAETSDRSRHQFLGGSWVTVSHLRHVPSRRYHHPLHQDSCLLKA